MKEIMIAFVSMVSKNYINDPVDYHDIIGEPYTAIQTFVKFGSVDALREYFGKNQEPSTADLIEAMNRFSEAIKICRTSTIESGLKNLGQHIKTFRESENKDIKIELFAKIIDTVESEYGNLISGNASRPDIIRWCMDKGFWQQAITLCTEWLPEEIVDREIFKPKNKLVAKDAEIEGVKFGRNWKQTFVIRYEGKDSKEISKKVSEAITDFFMKKFKKILPQLRDPAKIPSIGEEYGDLKKFVEEYGKAKKVFELCKIGKKPLA